jgi:hypothetical protein
MKLPLPRSPFIPLKCLLIFCASSVAAQNAANIANTRTPLGEDSQLLNNTPKATAAPTPPMGWNSWDNYGLDITEEEFRTQVDFVSDHLRRFGYTYMVIDAGGSPPTTDFHRRPTAVSRRLPTMCTARA